MLSDDADLFYDLELAFEGQPLTAQRTAIPGHEEPDFGYRAGVDAPAPRIIPLSPLAVGERPPHGHGPYRATVTPSRDGAAGRLVVTVRVVAGPDHVARWERARAGLAPIDRPDRGLPLGRARVGAFLAPEPDTALLVETALASNPSLFPGIPGVVPIISGGEARFTFMLPALEDGGVGPDLLVVGDGLEVLFVRL